MNNITAVIVSYNQAELLKAAYSSIRKCSDMPIIIVDGSQPDNPCKQLVFHLAVQPNVKIYEFPHNVGHGKGMDFGIRKAQTDYVLLMDSDVTIDDGSCIPDLIAHLKRDEKLFGVGQIVTVNEDGTNVPADDPDAILYLHPHFAIINREVYFKLPGFVHHGAPCIRTMQHLHTFKKYGLAHFNVSNYVTHKGRGTRALNPKEFLKGWE
jgi:glycosyltransferase involved in cell wall biosynthesis